MGDMRAASRTASTSVSVAGRANRSSSSSPTPLGRIARSHPAATATGPVDDRILSKPTAYLASEYLKDWCAAAGVQMVLSIQGHADTSVAFQRTLMNRVGEWEGYSDSHNGQWGPAAMVEALAAYGV